MTTSLSGIKPARQLVSENLDGATTPTKFCRPKMCKVFFQVVALLHNAVGPRATKDIVEWLLGELVDDDSEVCQSFAG